MADKAAGRVDKDRDPGGFVAIPWIVMDCPAYLQLSHTSRSLLYELARQFVKNNNGRLVLCAKHMERRGWKSPDVINRAKKQLLALGFIYLTRRGGRPNKAAWYAVTWRTLNEHHGYDWGAASGFKRSAFMKSGVGQIDDLNTSAVVQKPALLREA
ncbi:hypothetical protein ACN9MU_16600 [Pseudoduganella sp. R-32]|uniref:hypothetical protein n=1 Tax=Pseudoduganella sp. R-32 TaxID=3404061 RepID=UPI003CF977F3